MLVGRAVVSYGESVYGSRTRSQGSSPPRVLRFLDKFTTDVIGHSLSQRVLQFGSCNWTDCSTSLPGHRARRALPRVDASARLMTPGGQKAMLDWEHEDQDR